MVAWMVEHLVGLMECPMVEQKVDQRAVVMAVLSAEQMDVLWVVLMAAKRAVEMAGLRAVC